MTINLVKEAYHLPRENDRAIFKGFGFEHLSDATAFYVHPQNQSYRQATTLAQPIGESLVFFTEMMQQITQSTETTAENIFVAPGYEYLQVRVPEAWRVAQVFEDVVEIRGQIRQQQLTYQLLDSNGQSLVEPAVLNNSEDAILPLLMLLMIQEYVQSKNWQTLFDRYLKVPNVAAFVQLHEDFYQDFKQSEQEIIYSHDIKVPANATSLIDTYKIREQNRQSLEKVVPVTIKQFELQSFSKESQKLIPKLAPELVLDNRLNGLVSAIVTGDVQATLLQGPAGTGKTIACKLMCQQANLPLLAVVNGTENLDEDILSKFLPEKNQIIFRESYVTKAIREGGAVVFEEINFGKPQYLAFLNSLLDDNGFVRLDNGDLVQRHPNFRFFATMNLGYFGTQELNQALFNRFNVVVEMNELSDHAIERMLRARVPEVESMLPKVMAVYHKIKLKIAKDELDAVLSPRNLENWVKLARYQGYLKAAEMTIIPIANGDQYFAESIRGILMVYQWE